MTLHKLLDRQLRRHLLAAGDAPLTREALEPLLEAISQAYADADADRAGIERSLDLMSAELTERNAQLRTQLVEQQALIRKLEEAHNQLLQSEKMASIGQLAAGVAHEINNPIGFVGSNLGTLRDYVAHLIEALTHYQAAEGELGEATRAQLGALRQRLDLDYLRDDVVDLLRESAEGIQRVKQIVQDLKDFSHVDEAQWQWANLHKGLDSTLNIVHNEIKYVAEVVKEYGPIPDVECLASQINQVFLNLLVNAGHAMQDRKGRITIRTGMQGDDAVFVEISDQGCGIPEKHLNKIFDPFFTTKPVGKGTGLGLSLSYSIVGKHEGHIEVRSETDVGTTFKVVLPIRRQNIEGEDAATAA